MIPTELCKKSTIFWLDSPKNCRERRASYKKHSSKLMHHKDGRHGSGINSLQDVIVLQNGETIQKKEGRLPPLWGANRQAQRKTSKMDTHKPGQLKKKNRTQSIENPSQSIVRTRHIPEEQSNQEKSPAILRKS